MVYDYLVVGSGLYGAIFAHETKARSKSVLVADKRPNVGGNIYTEKVGGINDHVYTEPIDAYFGYSLGILECRSVRFENETLDIPNFQGNAAVNYTDQETSWTRIIEHKWFEFGKDENGNDLPKTIISREYSSEWRSGDEPYYPVNDEKNSQMYQQYKALAEKEDRVIFGGRLGEYKYYEMDQVIAVALQSCEQTFELRNVIW